MTNQIIIIALVIALIYLYQQNKKLKGLPAETTTPQTIYEIGEDHEELVAERDEAIREKKETEQELLSVNNRLRNKNQEVQKKEEEIERLKGEKGKVETALNAKLKELKEKYSKQGQLLDTESLENNKLVEKIESLETKLTELETENKKTKKEQQEQLRQINLLFDDQAKDYPTIEFAGLYSLLEKLTKKKMPGSF